jgi:hypothetical protein
MGMDQKVIVPPEKTPAWTDLQAFLAAKNLPVQMRMIDGELAFPEEAPPDDWRELRVSMAAGMITMRRESDGIALIIWGNADANLRQAWNTLTWAIAHLSGGRVHTEAGIVTADEFAKTEKFPRCPQ